jgi:hypothetical protein
MRAVTSNPFHRWQNTTLRRNFGYPGSTLMRESCPAVDEIKIYNKRGEFRAKLIDDVPPSAVWIRDLLATPVRCRAAIYLRRRQVSR